MYEEEAIHMLPMRPNTMKWCCAVLGIMVIISNPLQLFTVLFKAYNNYDKLMY